MMAADPAAAAIPDSEAEDFVVVANMLHSVRPELALRICRAVGVHSSYTSEKARRRAVILTLRRWRNPQTRDVLMAYLPEVSRAGFPFPSMNPELWTQELFREAFERRADVAWLVHIGRKLGRFTDLQPWLATLGEHAWVYYQFWLNIGRLLHRRFFCPPAAAGVTEANQAHMQVAAASMALEETLRERDRQSGDLRGSVRRLEQDRKEMRSRARRAELEAKALLPQARGEVDAARKALKERLVAHERELAEQARRQEALLVSLRAQLDGIRHSLIKRLSSFPPVNALDGRTVLLQGEQPELEAARLLVETAGGQFATQGGEIVLEASATLVEVEQALRRHALKRVLIMTDGLHRRKGKRPGIAVAGFHAYTAGGHLIAERGEPVCCGTASSAMQAEYGGLAMALSWLLATEPAAGMRAEVWTDCKFMVNRLRQTTPPERQLGCVMLDRLVRRQLQQLHALGCQVDLRWVPRERVHAVDRLCDWAYRQQTWYHRQGERRPLKAFLEAI